MPADLLLKALIAMGPVLILLLVFDRLDVFNLIPMRDISLLVFAGGVLGIFAYFANWRVSEGFPIPWDPYTRYIAPVVEECLKAIPIIAMFRGNRLGFKLDAAIAGFAVGAGFSILENSFYLSRLATETNVTDWLVRGFGTAVMHGAATAIFAVISHEMSEKQAESAATQYSFNALVFIPGLLVAMFIHSGFNHLSGQPLLAMALVLLLAPLTLFLTLARSERATRQWLVSDAAAHRRILADIRGAQFAESNIGSALRQDLRMLKGVDADSVLAFVELKVELVLRAEELILASHEGATAAAGEAEREKFKQLDALEKRLGKSVVAAVETRLGFTRNDLYELGRLRASLEDN